MHLVQRFQHRSLHEPFKWAVVFLLICVVVAVLTCGAASAEDVLGKEAIVASPVQSLEAKADDYAMPDQVVLNMYQPPQPDFLANYSRTADGQWHIPQQVDRANPWLRLLILGPDRPTIVDLAIYVDGEPYAAARERLIDGLMDHATLESLVRDAVKVPIPEDSDETESAESESVPAVEATEEEAIETAAANQDSGEEVEESAAEDEDPDDEDNNFADATEKESEENEPKKPVVEVKQRATRSVAQRLVNYLASAEVDADREEIRWLMAEWTGGPALLTLGPAMNWQRVNFAPLWNALDADGDQLLSAPEVAAATERLSQADVDENSIVELEELLTMHKGNATAPHSYPLVMAIDYETDWQQLNSHLQAAYGRRAAEVQGPAPTATSALLTRIAQGDPTLTAGDLAALVDERADVSLRVTLGKQDTPQNNEIALLSASEAETLANDKMVTVVRGAEYLEFSAGETEDSDASDPAATQIAIGAVVDGYPLFRLVDRNGDRRLSPRECRGLKNVLAAIDLDGNGAIEAHEQPTAIRISITRGPHAHEMLAEPSSAAREFASAGLAATTLPPTTGPAKEVPSWFADMDRNHDGDLSRSEFLGTSEQFKELDRDQDGLIGSREAGE